MKKTEDGKAWSCEAKGDTRRDPSFRVSGNDDDELVVDIIEPRHGVQAKRTTSVVLTHAEWDEIVAYVAARRAATAD